MTSEASVDAVMHRLKCRKLRVASCVTDTLMMNDRKNPTVLEPDSTEIDRLLLRFGEQYEQLREVAGETVRHLGNDRAGFFTFLGNDWIDIGGAITDTYQTSELINSLLYLQYASLLKEVQWLQLFFLTGNYPLVQRSLRYVWELIFRAFIVDADFRESRDGSGQPGSTLDDKVQWLEQQERYMFQWKGFVQPTLRRLLPQVGGTELESHYKFIWDRLNESVHPSKALLDRIMGGAPGFLVSDNFDKEWAEASLAMAMDVFDLIWLATVSSFPMCAELIAHKGLHLDYPIVRMTLAYMST